MNEIEFEIPELPKTMNQLLRQSKWVITKEKNKWHRLVYLATLNQVPEIPFQKCKLVIVRYSSRSLDYDNLVSGCKFLTDGCVKAKLIKDDNFLVTGTWEVSWQKSRPRHGKVWMKIIKVE